MMQQAFHIARTTGRTLRSAANARYFASSDDTWRNRVVRFIADEGLCLIDLADDHSRAYVVAPGADGKHELSSDLVDIGVMLAPVDPPAIYGIGLNYRKHAEEVGLPLPKYPVFFMKPHTSVLGHHETIIIPKCAQDPAEVDYEAELAVIIGKMTRNATVENAMESVLGYTIANDVSARRWQGKRGGGQWCRAKSFDTFCPLGPYITPKSAVPDPHNLTIRSRLNRRVMQESNTSDMIFSIPQIIAFLSQGTTLMPGTVILTGTPEGVGFSRSPPVFLQGGDRIQVEIEGLGYLENGVVHET